MKSQLVLLLLMSVFLIQCVQKEPTASRDIASTRTIAQSLETLYPYSSCNQNNNYLEHRLQNMSFEYFESHEKHWTQTLPLKCIQFAQKNFSGSYASCENEHAKPKVIKYKPCLSENYTMLVYNAYNDVQNCFNLNPKDSFLQIMIESGFHINAINKTGFDAGIAQFTKNGILRVMKHNIVSRTSRYLLESSNPSCARIASVFKELQKDAFKLENRCSMSALPQNPYRALVLQYLHSMRDQMDLKRLLEERSEIKHLVDQKLIDQLTFMAYNRGISGTLRIMDGYIKNRQKANATITREDLDLWKNLSEARKILKQEPIKRDLLKKAIVRKLSLAEYAIIQGQDYLTKMAEAQAVVPKDCL